MQIIIFILLIIFFVNYIVYPSNIVEGFESLTNCINQGYPKDWCMQTPLQSVLSSGSCYCGNRQLGTYQSDGKCHCPYINPILPYYVDNVFHDYLG